MGRGIVSPKTQISFRNGNYLGSRESWVEYPIRRLQYGGEPVLSPPFEGWFHRDTLSA